MRKYALGALIVVAMALSGCAVTNQNLTLGTGGIGSDEVLWQSDGVTWTPSSSPPPCDEPLAVAMPVDRDKVTGILYPGQYRGGGFKPHGGFRFDSSQPEDITIRSPVDGYLTSASSYLYDEASDLQIWIDIHTPCGIIYRFDHLRDLSPKLQESLAFLPEPKVGDSRGHSLSKPLAVERGEVLATAVGFSSFEGRPNVFVDYGVYDLRQKNAASQAADWPVDDHGWSELAPYGLCWLDLLPDNLDQHLRTLSTGNEGTTSVYCD